MTIARGMVLLAGMLATASGCGFHKAYTRHAAPPNTRVCDTGCAATSCAPVGPPVIEGTPAVTYPYYTVRGPRDYFANPPRDIGR